MQSCRVELNVDFLLKRIPLCTTASNAANVKEKRGMDDQFAKLQQIEEIRYRAFYKGIGKARKSIFKEERDEKEKEEREMFTRDVREVWKSCLE